MASLFKLYINKIGPKLVITLLYKVVQIYTKYLSNKITVKSTMAENAVFCSTPELEQPSEQELQHVDPAQTVRVAVAGLMPPSEATTCIL